MKLTSLPGLFLMAASITAPSLHGALVTFNNATTDSLGENFVLLNGTNPRYVQQEFGGVGDSGSVEVQPNSGTSDNTALYGVNSTPEAIDFSTPGSTVVLSMFVTTAPGTNSGTTANILTLGVVDSPTTAFSGSAGNMLTTRFHPTSTGGDVYQMQIQTKTGGSSSTVVQGSTFALVHNHWYRLNTTFTNQSDIEAGRIAVSGSLEYWGTDGTAFDSVIAESVFETVYVNSILATDDSLYAGFRSNNGNGARNLDNFELIPEPTSIVLFASGALLLLRRRNRQ